MTFFYRYKSTLSILFILLLLIQVNALPIHEYNLRQQGYHLIHVPPAEWSAEGAYHQINGIDLYNIALCEIHFRIQSTSQYAQLMFVMVLLSNLVISLRSSLLRQGQGFQNILFHPTNLSRAPPVLPSTL
ncbi:MAG: hypothetical protein ABEK50_07835 [bacterium]